MSQWIEVQARYEKLADNGTPVKVTDPYLVDALSCTEAEARVVEDTKGVRTPEYIIKRKLMLQVHGISIKEL